MRFSRLFVTLSMLFVTFVLSAQVTTATLSGTVSDGSETLPAAVVKATYEPTGVVYYVTTDINGTYQFLNVLPGGPYSIQVSMIGYQNTTVMGVYLNMADKNVLDILLKEETIGLDELVVTAKDMSNMSSERSGSLTTISAKTISLTPSTSRSMNDVMSLTPQASVTTNGFAVGGGNYRQSSVTVDGAAFNNGFGIGSNLPAGGTPISLDALDQMAISITPFDVRQSGFVGGAIQTTTKAGTNEWKFSAYDYFRHDKLQGARLGSNFKNGNRTTLTNPSMLKNTVGFTVGGPIIKNKLFFFVNGEYDVDNAPGQKFMASTDGTFGGQVKRPTVERMDMMRNYMIQNYNYDPGLYQGYSYNTPDWKILARLDWNINQNHHLQVRYSYTHNYYTTSPSTSVSPFGSTALYDRNSYGRASQYALYFQNACYNQEQNFGSLATEWTARFAEGKGNNLLRLTWSHQYEPRSYNGSLFPTIDILENIDVNGTDTKAVYTTIGMDPFTYGNLRDVQTVTLTDNVTYATGKHTITAGAQFEYNSAINGYMQMGNGYYLYGSWDDFVNQATPLAFAITHANRTDLQQQFPTIVTTKYSVYAQDEVDLHKQFKLTYGLRLELPVYPALDCENMDFTNMYAKTTGWQTNQTPRAYLNISPRIGFNWDVLGNRKMIVRGGTGVFAGNLPMVWLVSAVGNSNTMQAQTLLSGGAADLEKFNGNFKTSIPEILETLYGGTFQEQELAAPTSPTILAKDLRLPTTWKTSLAIDFNLPNQWKISLEGIFNKDLNSVVVKKEGLTETQNGLIMTEGQIFDARSSWANDGNKNMAGKQVNPYLITNSDLNGYYGSFTGKVEKSWDFGLNLMAAYTFSRSMTLNDGLGDQVTSVFSTNTYSANGSNAVELGRSGFVAPHRVVACLSYRIPEKIGATTLSLRYEGQNIGYIGTQYSYTTWTPTMSAAVVGDGGAYNTIFIPTEDQLELMNFTSETNKQQFAQWIEGNKYAANHRGQFAERGCMTMPWHNQLDFKLEQNFVIADGTGRKHNIEVGMDINNFLNMLNPAWGTYKTMNNSNLLSWKNGVYTYNADACQFSTLASTASTWSMMLSLKYHF